MSQRSLPQSPKSPRSKSASCDHAAEEGQEEQPAADNEIQRAVEEELKSADRILQGSRNASRASQSRMGSPPKSPAAPQSRISSPPRSPEAPQSRICSPARSPEAPQSRICSPARSPEAPQSRISSPARSPQAPQSRAASVVQSRPPSGPTSRVASFRSPSTCEDESPRLPSPPQSAVTFGSRTASPGQRGQTPDYGSGSPTRPTSHYTMDRESAPQSAQCSPGKTASHAYSTAGSTKYSNKSGISCGARNLEEYEGEVAEAPYDNYMSPGNASSSGGVRCAASGGVSRMNNAGSRERAASMGMCSPGCKKYRAELEEPQEASEAPSFSMRGSEHPSSRGFEERRDPCGFEDRKTPCGFSERTMGATPTTEGPPSYSPRQPCHAHQTTRPPSPTYNRPYQSPGHVLEPPMKPPQVIRGPERSMTADIGMQHSSHHHHHLHEGPEKMDETDERAVSALAHLSQLRRTPSYSQCGLNQGLDFLNVCCQNKSEKKRERIMNLPQKPCLRQDEIQELINCETQDVESAWYLTSDERKTYKKPCPKQQKAKMSVKALVQAHAQTQSCTLQKEYSPLEHPDPEDISPELAAAMMFSQERGIKMEECPNDTITSLFPDEPRAPFPEKLPQSSISVVDRSSKDQEEMIEKSASVPSEGVSDSAYTRRMKGKGEDMGPQRSFDVDFAIGQSKREYVLVAQTPQRISKVQYRGGSSPPWFPGYFSAFPNEEGMKIVSSPSNILNNAWMHSNPKNVPTSDVIVLD